MRRLLWAKAVGAAVLAAPAWAAPTPVSPAPERLVEKLSSDRYSEREAAGQALLKLGTDALPALDHAAGGIDPEAKSRAARIAGHIRRADENAKLLAVPPVSFDYAAVPLAAAVADLKAKTGILLGIAPNGVSDQLRPITAKAGPLPPWEALEAFCRAAGLREVFSADGTAIAGSAMVEPGGRRRIAYSLAEIPQTPPTVVPVLLADGKPDALPGDRSTAVRVAVLPAGFAGNRVVRGAGEVVLNLDVTPLTGLKWQEATAVRVYRAIDETGRPVSPSHRPEPPAAVVNAYGGQVLLGAGIGGNVVFDDVWETPRVLGRPNPRVVPVKLRTDDRAISRLRVLEGAVVGEVCLPNQTLIEVSDLQRAAGTTYHGPNDAKLTITGYEAKPNQLGFTVRMRVEGPNPWTMQRLGIRNKFAVMNTLPVMPGDGILLSAGLGFAKFADEAGKPLASPTVTMQSQSDDGLRQTQDLELTFPKANETHGGPAKLTVIGNKGVTAEVPFRLMDVKLP